MLILGGKGSVGACDDGTKPTCSDGNAPAHAQGEDRRKVACPDGTRPQTCEDGSTPTRANIGGSASGGSSGRGGCAKADRVCCDGSKPVNDGDRSTKPCTRGRPVCDVTTQC